MLFRRFVLTALAFAGGTTGCASQSSELRRPREATTRAPSTVVTATEIGRVGLRGTVMDAVERIRPAWLLSRGSSPLVSIDGGAAADLSTLRMIPVSHVRELRLERSSSSLGRAAITPNGDMVVGDVIVVITRQR
jgi:hypothetical protein